MGIDTMVSIFLIGELSIQKTHPRQINVIIILISASISVISSILTEVLFIEIIIHNSR